jgi:DNA-binding NarL/FixJ family response regulator
VIRVLIVDDHAFVRATLRTVLGKVDGVLVVGECSDGAEVPEVTREVGPDVVVMDVQMPRVRGTTAARDLLVQHPAVRVLMLSGCTDAATVEEAFLAGAVGFMQKGGDVDRLVNAVRAVAAGGAAWPTDDQWQAAATTDQI